MKAYEKPEIIIVEFSILEDITDLPGMGGGVGTTSEEGWEDEE